MQKKMGIYQIRNTINNKVYIGSTINRYSRRWKHFDDLKKKKHHSSYLQNAFDKYGRDVFVFEMLEFTDEKEKLVSLEQSWIDKVNPEYNIRKIAQSNLGMKHSEETKEKIRRNGNLGRKFTGKALENIRAGVKKRNYEHTQAQRKASSINIIEYNKSEAHRKVASKMGKLYGPKNLKKAHAKRRISEDIKEAIKTDLKAGMKQKDAAIKYGYSKITICRIANNKRWGK